MPPRLPTSCTAQLVNCLEPNSLTIHHAAAVAAASSQSWFYSPKPRQSASRQQSSSFSTTAPLELTRPQRRFRKFLRSSQATELREVPEDGRPSYLGDAHDAPFPNNPDFKSQPVLSEEARELIWENVMIEGLPLKAVSARYHVDMRRVAAVVRMKAIEKKWESSGKDLARPYARAVMAMLPKSNLRPHEPTFEPINDIHVSSFTQQQLFVPVPESRRFTRVDAAKAFGDHVLPPEKRMRIPELLEFEKNIAAGVDERQARATFLQNTAKNEKAFADSQGWKRAQEVARTTKVNRGRFEFRVKDVNVDWSGVHGKDRGGVGWRYGVPFNDRKKGAVKIPTKVG